MSKPWAVIVPCGTSELHNTRTSKTTIIVNQSRPATRVLLLICGVISLGCTRAKVRNPPLPPFLRSNRTPSSVQLRR